eukprot:754984-Hanusia_phi.AAC.2
MRQARPVSHQSTSPAIWLQALHHSLRGDDVRIHTRKLHWLHFFSTKEANKESPSIRSRRSMHLHARLPRRRQVEVRIPVWEEESLKRSPTKR